MRDARVKSYIQRQRRTQIIASAIAVLADVGYANTSFVRIAQHACISPGLISYHFTDKDELIVAVVDTVIGDMRAAIQEQLHAAGEHRFALRTIIETQVRYFATHTAEVTALAAIRTAAAGDGRLVANRQREHAITQLSTFFAAGQAAGQFASFEPRNMAVAVMGALELVPVELRSNPDADPESLGKQLADIFERAAVTTLRVQGDSS